MLVTMKKIMHNPMRQLPRQRKEHGFTMIELLITIVIIGILTAAALPSFKEFIINQRIKTASFDFVSSLAFTRSEAIKSNKNIALLPKNALQLELGWEVRESSTEPVRKDQSTYPSITISCISGTICQYSMFRPSCNNVTYTPDGRIFNSASGTFEISSDMISNPQKRCISVDGSGRVFSKRGGC